MRFSVLCAIFATLFVYHSLFGTPAENCSDDVPLSHRLDRLERRLKEMQNLQEVEIIDISLSGFSDKNDYLKFKRNELLQKIKNLIGSIDRQFFVELDSFPTVAYEFLTILAMKSNWSVNRSMIPNLGLFINNYVCLLPNYCLFEGKEILNSLPLISLTCGHNICIKCLILSASQSINMQINIFFCKFCASISYFDINAYCKLFDDSTENTIDMLSKIQRKGLLFILQNHFFKKCPKKSCDCILKMILENGVNLITISTIATCPSGHSFCLFCNSSSENHFFLCYSFVKMFVFGEKLYFSDLFVINIAKTQTACQKCDRLMCKINSSEIEFKAVREFLGDGSFLFCVYCSHLQVEDAGKNVPGFYNALALEERNSGNRLDVSNEHIKLLKKHYFTILSTVVVYYPFFVNQESVETFTDDYLNAYVVIYDRFLKMYCECIENILPIKSLENLNRLGVFSMQLSRLLVERIQETDYFVFESPSQLKLIEDFKLLFSNATYLQNEFMQHELFILLQHIIKTKLYRTHEFQPSFIMKNVVYHATDPTICYLEYVKNFLLNKSDLKTTMEELLDRPLNDFDYLCIVYSSKIESLLALKNAEDDCHYFLHTCRIPIPKTCAVCFKRYTETEHVLPDCLHDMACKECIVKYFKSCIEDRNWNADGFVLCMDEDCSGIFQPTVVLEYLPEKHKALRKNYENSLFNKFYRAYSKNEKFIECVKCGKYLQLKRGSRDMHVFSSEENFFKKYDLYLKTVQCPNCSQKICFNCRQPTIHYSSHCGINTQIETAAMATMCPGCKAFGVRIKDCPSMTCTECHAEFCAGCAREPFLTTTCYNSTYPAGQYNNQHVKIIDEYFEKCAKFLQPLLKHYHKKLSAAVTILKKYEISSASDESRILSLLHASIEFFQWHRLLRHYVSWAEFRRTRRNYTFILFIGGSNAYLTVRGFEVQVIKNLEEIQSHGKDCISFLATGDFSKCLNSLELMMKKIELRHNLFKKLKTSSRVILPSDLINSNSNGT